MKVLILLTFIMRQPDTKKLRGTKMRRRQAKVRKQQALPATPLEPPINLDQINEALIERVQRAGFSCYRLKYNSIDEIYEARAHELLSRVIKVCLPLCRTDPPHYEELTNFQKYVESPGNETIAWSKIDRLFEITAALDAPNPASSRDGMIAPEAEIELLERIKELFQGHPVIKNIREFMSGDEYLAGAQLSLITDLTYFMYCGCMISRSSADLLHNVLDDMSDAISKQTFKLQTRTIPNPLEKRQLQLNKRQHGRSLPTTALN